MAESGEHTVFGEFICEGTTRAFYTPAKQLDAVKTFDFFSDDVLIATYPRAGNYIQHHIENCFEGYGDFYEKS